MAPGRIGRCRSSPSESAECRDHTESRIPRAGIRGALLKDAKITTRRTRFWPNSNRTWENGGREKGRTQRNRLKLRTSQDYE